MYKESKAIFEKENKDFTGEKYDNRFGAAFLDVFQGWCLYFWRRLRYAADFAAGVGGKKAMDNG